ncbi:hypothetical protein [Symbioplanes lichenis]|uniref:hypothetical protein n=1 Tax=Symbioplanes lichenis TaxID=1629072 RepID=UPI0027385C1D|nr:hypothetical protein [Actinoplanes lichenis]
MVVLVPAVAQLEQLFRPTDPRLPVTALGPRGEIVIEPPERGREQPAVADRQLDAGRRQVRNQAETRIPEPSQLSAATGANVAPATA